jgi:hypothetical protein
MNIINQNLPFAKIRPNIQSIFFQGDAYSSAASHIDRYLIYYV